ncbi:MAG TPA: glycoside hydrolase family 28 protein [Opitutaceae bacterium]|nr:glycoside hydrolase family 28 protein [Opitutaceae bacterium]
MKIPRWFALLSISAVLSAGLASPARAQAPAPTDLAHLSPAQPSIPGHRFNVKDFGAVGDAGATLNTDAFHKAVAAVNAAGGGTLVVPKGVYFTGPFDLGSNTNLHLEAGATLLFSPKFDDYRSTETPGRYRPLIQVVGAHDVLVSGSGTINGNGEAWWPEARRFKAVANAHHASGNTSPRPVMLSFRNCQRIRVEGVTLTNAPVFNLVQNHCDDVTVEGIRIINPEIAPNTDGIDPKDCRRVLISHCYIDTGDDNIALGGSGGYREEDILVTDCTFLHGHGCSIGSGTQSGVRNMLVRRCTFDGTDTGVRFKSGRGRGGLVENVTYEDLTMKNVHVAISISSYYGNTPIDTANGDAKPEPVTDRTPRWRNLTIRNVTATHCQQNAGLIAGLPEMPAENIVLDHVTIDAPKGLRIMHANGVTLRDVHITATNGPGVIASPSVQGLVREP